MYSQNKNFVLQKHLTSTYILIGKSLIITNISLRYIVHTSYTFLENAKILWQHCVSGQKVWGSSIKPRLVQKFKNSFNKVQELQIHIIIINLFQLIENPTISCRSFYQLFNTRRCFKI